MDPLSLTASIVAVLQLTAKLTNYLNDVKRATSGQQKVAVEASNLYSLLTTLRFRVEEVQTNDAWFDQVKQLGVPGGPLDQFKAILEQMVEQTTVSGNKERLKAALTWKWTKAEIDEALQRIERLKMIVTLALANDTFRLAQTIHAEVGQLASQTAALKVGVDQLTTKASRDQQDRLSYWLQVPDPSSNYQAALAKRHARTGTWLLTSSQLQQWKSSTSSFLWLHGSAGCGKTVLSATALQNILEEASHEAGAVVVYFYFDFNNAEKQKTASALRSLLFQFALQNSDCLHILEQEYIRCNKGNTQPSNESIQSMLMSALALPNKSYLVLDALDECIDRSTLLPFIRTFVTSSQHEMHLLATSRKERDIDEELRDVANHVVDIQSAEVDRDISAYVRDRLATDTKLKKWPTAIKDEIESNLMSKANGMFRWAYCQLESLRTCIKLSALRKALASLPKTLDETYARIISHLETEGQLTDAVAVLKWLCFANRPLKLLEVIEVLAIQNETDDGFDPNERLPDPEDILAICSSLVSCQRITGDTEGYDNKDVGKAEPENDEDIEDACNDVGMSNLSAPNHAQPYHRIEVRLAHFSVKEYLLSDRSCLGAGFLAHECHDFIAESSLRYLLYASKQLQIGMHFTKEFPLIKYVAEHWWQHLQYAGDEASKATVGLVEQLLVSQHTVFVWVLCYEPHSPDRYVQPPAIAADAAPSLYYISYLDLPYFIDFLLDQGADIDAKGESYGTALQAASNRGNARIVQMLLDRGADVNIWGGFLGTSLQEASEQGHTQVAKILLENGAEVNALGQNNDTALHEAAGWGHLSIVQMLLERGATTETSEESYHGTPLQSVSRNGYTEIVRALLNHGANVHAKFKDVYNTPIHEAAAHGHVQILQLLLDHGADINDPGDYGSPLLSASERGQLQAVQMLLTHGANPNSLEGGWTALQEAAGEGHTEIVKLLIENGADVNARRAYGYHHKDGRNALDRASYNGHTEVARILLENGADINAAGRDNRGTALSAAAVGGHLETAQMLLERGANVNGSGAHESPLANAASTGYMQMLQLLLDHGADVNGTGFYGTVLSDAVGSGQLQAGQLLIEKGANVEPRKHWGELVAKMNAEGSLEMVQLLLEKGVDVHAASEGWGQVLATAAGWWGNIQLVQLLLDRGVDIEAMAEYGTPLWYAAIHDHLDILQLLLDNGANPNPLGCWGTPLQSALKHASEEVARLLRAYGAQEPEVEDVEDGDDDEEAEDDGVADEHQHLETEKAQPV